jgi:DNA-binding NarL/FixJ family response regulator
MAGSARSAVAGLTSSGGGPELTQPEPVAKSEPFPRLSTREQAVLHELIDGRTAGEIAAEAFVSIATVRTQISAVLRKLGVHSQLAAVALARRAQWDEPRQSPVAPISG